jgi:hypothetical protein
MSISVNPVVGFDFLSSLTSVYGESITLSLENSATRDNTDGLQLSGSNRRAVATAPSALLTTFPITIMARVSRIAAGTGGECGFGVNNNASASWQYAMEHRGTAAGWRLRGLNGGTLVTLTTSDTPVNPQTVTYFLEFTTSAFSAWTDTTSVGVSTASRSSPTYGGTPRLYVGADPGTSGNLGANVTHFAMWNDVLTGADRTALVADPMAYMASGPENLKNWAPIWGDIWGDIWATDDDPAPSGPGFRGYYGACI